MKIIKVSVCNRCPHLVCGKIKDMCNLVHYKEITKTNAQLNVPNWCPLEDYEGDDKVVNNN